MVSVGARQTIERGEYSRRSLGRSEISAELLMTVMLRQEGRNFQARKEELVIFGG